MPAGSGQGKDKGAPQMGGTFLPKSTLQELGISTNAAHLGLLVPCRGMQRHAIAGRELEAAGALMSTGGKRGRNGAVCARDYSNILFLSLLTQINWEIRSLSPGTPAHPLL